MLFDVVNHFTDRAQLLGVLVIDLFAGVSGMNGATLSIITGSVLATLAVTAWMLRRRFREIP